MKLLNLLVVATSVISTALAANNYQITWYGCPRHCDSQRRSSCELPTWPTQSDGTKHFVALSTHLSGFKSYCGKRVVVMLADGQKQMINVKVVDSCSSCPEYHLDLSHTSFGNLLPHDKGEADCIFSIYDNNGTKLLGPIYRSLSQATSVLKMSKDQLLSAFDNTAKQMVRSGNVVGKLGSAPAPASSKKATTTKKVTTTRKTTITTTKKVTSKIVISIVNKNPVTAQPKQTTTKNIPSSLASKQASPVNYVPPNTSSASTAKQTPEQDPAGLGMIPVDEIAKSNDTAKEAPKSTPKEAPKAAEVNESEGGSSAAPVVAALGVGCAFAGIGLVFLKRNKAHLYESMKNSNLMRTLSRRRR